MIRLEVTVTAADAEEAAEVLRNIIAERVDDGFTLGFADHKDNRYRFEVIEVD